MQDGGVILASGFPRDGGMETSDKSDTVQTVDLIQHMHSFTGGRLGLYLRSVRFGAERVRSGVEEVGVHGTSWK